MKNPRRYTILFLSAYDAASHQYWRKVLVDSLEEFEIVELSLPPRYFSWRARGNSLTWGFGDYPELNDEYDLVIATSMVDVATLKGFRPKLSRCPWIVYFHENQFSYPQSRTQNPDINIPLTSVYTALAADSILFNSQFNAETFICGTEKLLRKMPDKVPANLVDRLIRYSKVLPVPLNLNEIESAKISPQEKLKIIWNHRWEYDKHPQLLHEVLNTIESTIDYEIAIIGQSFRHSPKIFDQIKEKHEEKISGWGFQPSAKYIKILQESNVVLSTAMHDFQGLAVQQAMAYGCIPVCPNRMAYPEYIHPNHLFNCSAKPDSAAGIDYEAQNIANRLEQIYRGGATDTFDELHVYLKQNLIPKYREVIFNLLHK